MNDDNQTVFTKFSMNSFNVMKIPDLRKYSTVKKFLTLE
jgi:hypothetical protein